MNDTAKRSLLVAARNSLVIFALVAAFLFGMLFIAHTNLAPVSSAAGTPAHARNEGSHANR